MKRERIVSEIIDLADSYLRTYKTIVEDSDSDCLLDESMFKEARMLCNSALSGARRGLLAVGFEPGIIHNAIERTLASDVTLRQQLYV